MSVNLVDDVVVYGNAYGSGSLSVVGALSGGNITTTGNVSAAGGNSVQWNNAYSTSTVYQSVSSTYATLTGTQTLKNKTVIDWMTLVRGYNTVPTLLTTIQTGVIYTYVYNSTPTNKTYYRFISTDGGTDEFYTAWDGDKLSGLVASKSITI